MCVCGVGGVPGQDTNKHYFVSVCPCPSLAERHRKRGKRGNELHRREPESLETSL